MMDWLKKAPTAVIVTAIIMCGVTVLCVFGGFVALEYAGRDTADYSRFVNTLLNGLGLLAGGTGAVAGIAAARSASKAEDNTNGHLTANTAQVAQQAADRAVANMRGKPMDTDK